MSSRDSFRFAAVAGCIIMAFCLSGCSLIGYGAGLAIDNSGPDTEEVDPWKVAGVEPGRIVSVTLDDGSKSGCWPAGLVDLSQEQYTELYNSTLDQNDESSRLPAIGDTVDVKERGQYPKRYEFLGLGYGPRKLGRGLSPGEKAFPGSIYLYLALQSVSSGLDTNIYLNDLATITNQDGDTVLRSKLERLVVRGAVPLRTYLSCHAADGVRSISLSQARTIDVRRKKHAKWIGLAAGAAIDLALLNSFHKWGEQKAF